MTEPLEDPSGLVAHGLLLAHRVHLDGTHEIRFLPPDPWPGEYETGLMGSATHMLAVQKHVQAAKQGAHLAHPERSARLEHANHVIRLVASYGRRFFYRERNQTIAHMELDANGRTWWVSEYDERRGHGRQRQYLHVGAYARWKHFHHGGTMKALVEALRDYVMRGTPISRGFFGPWPKEMCDGDLWGYGEAASHALREALEGSPALRPLKVADAT